ncbi:MAG: restriction endonuclease subunit S [Pirellulales bacterium]|nr:restriction endonuclease subunit S [Pirellulales bacterium]
MEVMAETTHNIIDLGPIPEDWGIRPLKEAGRWHSGGTPSMKNPAYWSGDIPWVSPKDMKVSRLFDSMDHISAKAVADGARLLPAGAVLIVIRGMILAHSLPVARAERPLAFNQDMKALIVDASIDSNYVLYWLIGHAQKLRALTTESTHGTKRLPPETLYRVPFPFPPTLAEQEAIAGALSDADAWIESLEQLIAKKRQIKQAAMQELLTAKRRLPGFTGEWNEQAFSEVCWYQEGPGVRNSQFTTAGIKLLNGTNILRGELNLDSTSRFISEREAYGPYAHFLADVGDIVIASSGISIERFHEKVAYVRENDVPFCMNTSTIRFKPVAGKLYPHFLFQYLMSDNFKRAIGGQATGSAQLNFGPSHISKVAIPLPDESEQLAIANVLSEMDAEIAALEVKLSKGRQVKQGMMQELLTGRIRLI